MDNETVAPWGLMTAEWTGSQSADYWDCLWADGLDSRKAANLDELTADLKARNSVVVKAARKGLQMAANWVTWKAVR